MDFCHTLGMRIKLSLVIFLLMGCFFFTETWKNAYEYISSLSQSAYHKIDIIEDKNSYEDSLYGVYINYTNLFTALGTILIVSAVFLWTIFRRSKSLCKTWTTDEHNLDGKNEFTEITSKPKFADEIRIQDINAKLLEMEQNFKNSDREIQFLLDKINLMKLEMQLKFAEIISPVKEVKVIKPITPSHLLKQNTSEELNVESFLGMSNEVCLMSIHPDEVPKAVSVEEIIDRVNKNELYPKSLNSIPLKVMKATSSSCLQTSEDNEKIPSAMTESQNDLSINPQSDDTIQTEDPIKLVNSKLSLTKVIKSSIPRKCDIRATNSRKPETQNSESSLKLYQATELGEVVTNASKTEYSHRPRSSRQSKRKVKK